MYVSMYLCMYVYITYFLELETTLNMYKIFPLIKILGVNYWSTSIYSIKEKFPVVFQMTLLDSLQQIDK